MANGPGTSWTAGVADACEHVQSVARTANFDEVQREGQSSLVASTEHPRQEFPAVGSNRSTDPVDLAVPSPATTFHHNDSYQKNEGLSPEVFGHAGALPADVSAHALAREADVLNASSSSKLQHSSGLPIALQEVGRSLKSGGDGAEGAAAAAGSGQGDNALPGGGASGLTTRTSGGEGASGLTSRASGGEGASGLGVGIGSTTALSVEPSASLLEQVSREVIRKLRLAASADKAEDRHVVCEELFADITCPLDAAAQAALLGPGAQMVGVAAYAAGGGGSRGGGGGGSISRGAGEGQAAAPGTGPRGRAEAGAPGAVAAAVVERARGRGRLYYEVLAVHYATRAAADSARALLHLCQLLWDTPWVAPIYALLLHRFLLLPRDIGGSGGGGGSVASPTAGGSPSSPAGIPSFSSLSTAQPSAQPFPTGAAAYADSRVKHLNVLAHGARQLLLGDVHSGLSRFQPLWAFLTFEVAGLGGAPPPPSSRQPAGWGTLVVAEAEASAAGAAPPAQPAAAAAASLPPVASIDSLPPAVRPWLLAVAAAFLPYYCLDEQVPELARRFPPPGDAAAVAAVGPVGLAADAGAEGLDFLVVEVTDVLGRIHSEAGLLKYLGALRALARPPPEPATAAAAAAAASRATESAARGPGRAASATGQKRGRRGEPPAPQSASASASAAPLAGLPTITKLRLQNELYSLTSGGGPRYAPPEVRKAAFAALDALFPGGRSLRWLVRWASRTLHLEWLESDAAVDDPWVGGGWLGWIYWPIHWCTVLYGRLLLLMFQMLYGLVVWRPGRTMPSSKSMDDLARIAGTGVAISSSASGVSPAAASSVTAAAAAAAAAAAEGSFWGGVGGGRSGGGGGAPALVGGAGLGPERGRRSVDASAGGVGGGIGKGQDAPRLPWWRQERLTRYPQRQHE